MIPLLSRARARIADILDARTLARTVRLLSRQLDHAHLAGQIEEARADRAEERVAELELQLADWREASGELVAEQAAADLPDLEPADDSGPPSPLPADPYLAVEIQRGRADSLERRLAACELEREREHARADAQHARADDAEIERDASARSAGAHLRTIEELRTRLATHAPTVELQIPAVLAAESTPYAQWSAEYDARHAADEPAPETQPSERATVTREEPRP